MQIVVISDTHGRNEVLQELRERHPQASAFLHCGDSETLESYLDGYVSVQGNNDYYADYPQEVILNLENVRVFMTHGQFLRHHNRYEILVSKAKEHDCTLVFHGHTHIFDVRVINGITLVNPGSLYHSRDMSPPSYALVTIESNHISAQRINYPRTNHK